MLHGHPLTATLPEDLGFGERFWYWRGASGQSYIHSIYTVDACPPLPGAVFLLVRLTGGRRVPTGIGQFLDTRDTQPGKTGLSFTDVSEADEIHVHLLARNGEAALSVMRDLERAMLSSDEPVQSAGFAEPVQFALAFA